MFVEAEARQKLGPHAHVHQDAWTHPAVGEVRVADVLERQTADSVLVAQVGQKFRQVGLNVRVCRTGCGVAAVSERVLDGGVRVGAREPGLKHPDDPGVELHSAGFRAAGGLLIHSKNVVFRMQGGLDSAVSLGAGREVHGPLLRIELRSA